MQNKNFIISKQTIRWVMAALLSVTGVTSLVLAFQNSGNSQEDVQAVYTQAALTIQAQQLTISASVPTALIFPTPTPIPTHTLTPFITVTPVVSLTLPPLLIPTKTQGASSAVGCDNSYFLADVTIPDYTEVAPGQSMTKTWKVQNTGTCAWTSAYKIGFVAGNAMGASETAIGLMVNPGQSVDLSLAMAAPTTAGDSAGTWRLMDEKGNFFGTLLTIIIKVSGSTPVTPSTVSPTSSVVATPSFTPTSTTTNTPTETVVAP